MAIRAKSTRPLGWRLVASLVFMASAGAAACGSSAGDDSSPDGEASGEGGASEDGRSSADGGGRGDTDATDATGASDAAIDAFASDAPADASADAPDSQGCDTCTTKLAVGYTFACALGTDAKVRCWGDNTLGTTGQILPDGGVPSATLSASVVSGLSDVVDVAAGAAYACALTSTGGVFCWGDDMGSKVMPDAGAPYPNPVPVALPLPAAAARISVGFRSVCARLVDGRVYCAGETSHGSLGVDSGTMTLGVVPAPSPMLGVSGADDVSAVRLSTCVLLDGGVYCVGENGYGQLGVAGGSVDTIAAAAVVPLPARATSLGQGSGYDQCAIHGDGNVSCWGSNNGGTAAPAVLDDGPVAPTQIGVGNVSSVANELRHTCVTTKAGDVYCWGANNFGELAQPADAGQTHSGPSKVALPAPAKSAGVGGGFSCALLTTGQVVCWGTNASYALGRGAAGSDPNLVDEVPAPVVFLP